MHFRPAFRRAFPLSPDLLPPSSGQSPQPMRPLSGLLKRQLVRQLLDDERRAGRLEHFGPIASTAGLLNLVCEFIRQMKRLEIWPEQFAEACRERGSHRKDRELLVIYQAYQERLVAHNLYDTEGQFGRPAICSAASRGDSSS